MAAKKSEVVKARVLVDCHLGKVDDIIEISKDQAEAAQGQVDTDPAAVAYAQSLK